MQKLWRVMDRASILSVVIALQVRTNVKTYQTEHSKYVQFLLYVCQLCFTNTAKRKRMYTKPSKLLYIYLLEYF